MLIALQRSNLHATAPEELCHPSGRFWCKKPLEGVLKATLLDDCKEISRHAEQIGENPPDPL